MDNIQRSIVHIVIAVALDGYQEAEPRLVLGHGLVELFPVLIRGGVGLVGAVAVAVLGGEVVLKMGLVKAQRQPGGVAPVVGVGVGVGGHGGVAQTLQVTDHAVGVVQVQPVERCDAGHQNQRVGGQHLILGRVGAAAHVGADGVAVDRVGQVFRDRHNVGVGLQIRHKVKVIEALGQNQHNIGVVLCGFSGGGAGVAVRLGESLDRSGVAVALRLNDGVGHQAGGLNRARQISVGVVGVLPRPAVGGFGLDGHRAEVAKEHHQKDAQCTARHPHAAGGPAGAFGCAFAEPALHKGDSQNRQEKQRNLDDVMGNF